MRCPYCGGLNPDNATYCASCGRGFSTQPGAAQRPPQPVPANPRPTGPQQASPYQAPQPVQRPAYPQPQRPPVAPPVNPYAPAPQHVPPTPAHSRQRAKMPEPGVLIQPPEPPAPEPPAPFPPRTTGHLKELVQGALPYTLISDSISNGKRKTVRIAYRHCASWQQVATLLKAYQEFDEKKYDTIIIQGVFENDTSVYSFTNGQLAFDRNVCLGSQTLQRYQVETNNGFSSDSIRFVLTE